MLIFMAKRIRSNNKGWILVAPDGLSNDAALAKWVRTGADYASTLPGKH